MLGMSLSLAACGNDANVPTDPIQSDATEAQPGEFPDGQPYAEYRANGFFMRYPDWPHAGTGSVPSPDETMEIAVENAGCIFMLNILPIPEEETFEEFTRSRLQAQKSAVSGLEILGSDITPERAFVDAEVATQFSTVRSVSYVFPARGNSYGLGFVAVSQLFDFVCRPSMEAAVASVQID